MANEAPETTGDVEITEPGLGSEKSPFRALARTVAAVHRKKVRHEKDAPAIIDWQKQTLGYDRTHARMLAIAKFLLATPHRRVLDIGCSTGAMRRILPADVAYFGCDISDHAQARLEKGHFLQVDLNASPDLSFFEKQRINAITISGVLEYVKRPKEILRELRTLVDDGSSLIVSIFNFENRKPADHDPAWIYKPSLEELRITLEKQGWRVLRMAPLITNKGVRALLARVLTGYLGDEHPWIRKQALQYILLAEAR